MSVVKEEKTFPGKGRIRVMGVIPREDPGHPTGQRLEHHALTILDKHAVLSRELLQRIAEKHPEARWLYLTPPRAHYSFFGNGSGMENPHHARKMNSVLSMVLKVQAEGRGLERMARQVGLRGVTSGGLRVESRNGNCMVNWHGRTVFHALHGEVLSYVPGDDWESEMERLYYETACDGIMEVS